MTDTQTPDTFHQPIGHDPLDLLVEDEPVRHSRIDTAFYEAALTKSKVSGKALSYPLTAKSGDAKKEESALRQVASNLGFGLKVQVMEDSGRIKFQVAKKREYTPESIASRKEKVKATRAATKAKKEAEKAAIEKAEKSEEKVNRILEHAEPEKAKVRIGRR